MFGGNTHNEHESLTHSITGKAFKMQHILSNHARSRLRLMATMAAAAAAATLAWRSIPLS